MPTKSDLVSKVASETGQTQVVVSGVINCLLDEIAQSLVNAEKVQLAGFGTFDITRRAARNGRNPSTGEPLRIEASRSVKFKPSAALKDSV